MKKLLLTLSAFILVTVSGFAQNQHIVDSLQNQLKQLESERAELRNGVVSLRDSATVKVQYSLAFAFLNNDPDKAMDLARQALALSEQIGWKKGAARAYTNIGNVNTVQGDYPEALKNYSLAIKICESIGDRKGIAMCNVNIGLIYQSRGDYSASLKNFYACLKIFEELKDKMRISVTLNNIGNSYIKSGNYDEALKNNIAALKIAEELSDKANIGRISGDIGVTYCSLQNYPEALKYLSLSLKTKQGIGDRAGIATVYNNLGGIYFAQGNYPETLKNYFASLKINEELGDKADIASTGNNIGTVYIKLNRAQEGREWLQKGLFEATQLGIKEIIKNSYFGLAAADSALGNFKTAFKNYKMFVIYNDSLSNNENTKKITQQQMQFEFDKKEAFTKADQEKKDAVALEEIENQKLVRNGFMGGFATVLIFAGTFFRQRNRIKKEKIRSDNLLRNILPDEIAEELKETGSSKAKTHEMVSVMFTDFKDFTKISETVSAEMLVDELHTCFSAFDTILHKHKIEKIKTIGDAYMCVSGLPVSSESHATDIVKAAVEIMDYISTRKKEKEIKGEFYFELRIGINSGPVVAGIVGLKKFSYDIWGDTVNTAARMEHQGEAGKINISGTTYELIKDKFTSVHRGKITAKNKGEIDMYFINLSQRVS